MKNQVIVYTAPAVEPVTLTDVKRQLRLDSSSVEDNITTTQSIFPGDHVVAATYSLKGTGVDVLGYGALVLLESGTNGTSGTVDVKIQESDTDSDSLYTDWTGGAFTQITTANDNANYEIEYTGNKQYIRAVCTVGTATCDFGVSVITQGGDRSDDAFLSSLITTVRQSTEQLIGRSLITQTLNVYYDEFPQGDFIAIPYPPLQSITSIYYTDSDDTPAEFSSDYYYTDILSEPGRAVLQYGESWPSDTLRTYWPIKIICVSGYGASGSSVPAPIKQFILLNITDLYENRGNYISGRDGVQDLKLGMGLITDYRIW